MRKHRVVVLLVEDVVELHTAVILRRPDRIQNLGHRFVPRAADFRVILENAAVDSRRALFHRDLGGTRSLLRTSLLGTLRPLLFRRLAAVTAHAAAALAIEHEALEAFARRKSEKRHSKSDKEQNGENQRAGLTERTDKGQSDDAADKSAALIGLPLGIQVFEVAPIQARRCDFLADGQAVNRMNDDG